MIQSHRTYGPATRRTLLWGWLLLLSGVLPLYAADLEAQLATDQAAGILTDHDVLMHRLYSLYDPARLPARYQTLEFTPNYCVTLLHAEAYASLSQMTAIEKEWYLQKAVIARASHLPLKYISQSGNFKFHYDMTGSNAVTTTDNDNNGIPDFVEETAAAFDSSLRAFTNIGYQNFSSDNGEDGPEFDVYFVREGGAVFYGQTAFPTSKNSGTYIVMDPTFEENAFFTKGIDGARVTAAHELHHAVQFAYTLQGTPNFAFFEITATYMEDYVFDEINDYLQYISFFFTKPQEPFTSVTDFYQYGNTLFGRLVENLITPVALRRTWEELGRMDGIGLRPDYITALDAVLPEFNTTFDDMLNEYHVWNYFTGSRADTARFFRDGNLFSTQPEVDLALNLSLDNGVIQDTTGAIINGFLSPHYVTIDVPQSDTMRLELRPAEGNAAWKFSLLLLESEHFLEQIPVSTFGDSLTVFTYWGNTKETALLVATTVARGPSSMIGGIYSLDLHITAQGVDFPTSIKELITVVPESFHLWQNYPNPFNPITTIRFTVARESNFRLTVFDLLGREIKQLAEGRISEGTHSFRWDGMNTLGQPVTSGVYFYRLETKTFRESRKMLLLQ